MSEAERKIYTAATYESLAKMYASTINNHLLVEPLRYAARLALDVEKLSEARAAATNTITKMQAQLDTLTRENEALAEALEYALIAIPWGHHQWIKDGTDNVDPDSVIETREHVMQALDARSKRLGGEGKVV